MARLRAAVLAEYGTVCHLCGMPGADSPDHVIPRHLGGSDDLANLRPSHRSCNYARQDRPLDEWFAAHPLPSRAPPTRDW